MDPAYPPRPSAKECVKDYELQYYDSSKSSWIKILDVEDNYQRLREHNFDALKTQKIRLNVKTVNIMPKGKARVYEIRVYNE